MHQYHAHVLKLPLAQRLRYPLPKPHVVPDAVGHRPKVCPKLQPDITFIYSLGHDF